MTLKICVFKKIWYFHFHYINFLKLHFVEYVKFSKHFQWNNGTGSFICLYITWKKCKFIHKFPPMEVLLNIWLKLLHRNQADGALGEQVTTIWIHFTSWDGFSRENTQQIYFKLSSVIFLKNLDFYFLFLTCMLLFQIHEFKFWL